MPIVAAHLAGWQRDGDLAFVAEQDGCGVVLCGRRFSPDEQPTFDVEEQTPERQGTTFSMGSRHGLGMSFAGRCPPRCDVSVPKPGPETQPFVEGVHAGICSTALHQHVVAVSRPRMCQCGLNHSLAVPPAS